MIISHIVSYAVLQIQAKLPKYGGIYDAPYTAVRYQNDLHILNVTLSNYGIPKNYFFVRYK
jgi:hypothetical protein